MESPSPQDAATGGRDALGSATAVARIYPPAIAPTMKNGSTPFAIASGNGASGRFVREIFGANKKPNERQRRFCVAWSRIVPRNVG